MCAFRGSRVAVSQTLETTRLEHTRASSIPAESVIVCLTDAVLLFDKIERDLHPFLDGRRFGMAERSQWAWRLRALSSKVAIVTSATIKEIFSRSVETVTTTGSQTG